MWGWYPREEEAAAGFTPLPLSLVLAAVGARVTVPAGLLSR